MSTLDRHPAAPAWSTDSVEEVLVAHSTTKTAISLPEACHAVLVQADGAWIFSVAAAGTTGHRVAADGQHFFALRGAPSIYIAAVAATVDFTITKYINPVLPS